MSLLLMSLTPSALVAFTQIVRLCYFFVHLEGRVQEAVPHPPSN